MSRSVLHDWECDIERISGDSVNEMLDIAQEIYNTGYVRGKNYMSWVYEDIREEISRKANSGQWSAAVVYGLQKALAIIDKHMEIGK